jgi:hypothetical protein
MHIGLVLQDEHQLLCGLLHIEIDAVLAELASFKLPKVQNVIDQKSKQLG